MEQPCSSDELKTRLVALEAGLAAFKDLMEERDRRYAQRSLSQDDAVSAALITSKEAVTKAETATERRLETLNELRGVVVDQAQSFMPKSEITLLFSGLEKRIEALSVIVNAQESRGSGVKDAVGYAVGAVGLILAAIAIYFRH